LVSFDGLSSFGVALSLVSALAVAIASRPYLARAEGERGEYYALLLFTTLGAATLASSASLATVFLGLELLSLGLYALVGYRRERGAGTKAAFTYLILASAASAFLLFGMGLAYFRVGGLDLARITRTIADGTGGPLFGAGLAMMGAGFAFKLAIAPFHMWAPEVYEGADAPVAGLIASLSKAAMAVPLVRVLAPVTDGAHGALLWTLAAASAASMFAGNLIALREERVKRMLAGSSIAQLGYVLVALIAGGRSGASAALFYLAAYAIASLAAFGCVAAISGPGKDAGKRSDFRGLAGRRPFAAAAMTVALLSLAGMPLTAGFIGKYLLFSSGLGGSSGAGAGGGGLGATGILVILLAVNSAMSLFYYLRLVSVMYRGTEPAHGGLSAASATAVASGEGTVAIAGEGSGLAAFALAALVAIILVLGLVPGPAMEFISSFAGR
jgi:NADH-quinone oxidoreductase subunit N